MSKLSHQTLCEIGARWLRGKANCGIAYCEHKVAHSKEIPDAFGIRDYGRTTILLEAKVSRGDFLGDRKKHHRENPDCGMGDYRFFIVPRGLVQPNEVPPRWGLLEVSAGGKVFITKGPKKHITSLCGVDELRRRIEWGKERLNDDNPYVVRGAKSSIKYAQQEAAEVQDFLFPYKNYDAERELMYGALRMWFIASESGRDCVQHEKYYVNPMKDDRDSVEGSCKNMSR